MPDRERELAERWDTLRVEVAESAEQSGRAAGDVTIIVVTKTWPVSDLRVLHALGVRHFGENRHQEAEQKSAELRELAATWHFIGQIQSNKASRIASYADMVHSVDSVRVAQRLNSGAHNHDRAVDCLVQVRLDPSTPAGGRGGVREADIDDVVHAIETAGGLRLRGVMGVAPLGRDPRPAYRRLAEVSRRLQRSSPDARAISAGMSADFEIAIQEGATHVRVGSAVLGLRPLLG